MNVLKIVEENSIYEYVYNYIGTPEYEKFGKSIIDNEYDTNENLTIHNYFYDTRSRNVAHKILSTFDNEFLLKMFKEYDVRLMGGAILSLINLSTPNDYDLYFGKSIDRMQLKSMITNYNILKQKKFYLLYESQSSITYKFGKNKFQFIFLDHLMNISVRELFEEVDFTVCQCLYSFNEECFYISNKFAHDELYRNITFNHKTKYPISSLFRVEKYKNKGYRLETRELLKLSFSIANLKLETYEDVIKNMTSISTSYYSEFIDLLNEIKNNEFNIDEFLEMFDLYLESKEMIQHMEGRNSNSSKIKMSF